MIIYKVTNKVNGKMYIGLTTQKLRYRRCQHRYCAYGKNEPSYFYCAIRKHGWNSFEWEVIDKATNIEELKEKEKYWITYYQSTNRGIGYNLSQGGDGNVGYKHTKEAKKKLSEAHLRRSALGTGIKPFYAYTAEGKLINKYNNYRTCASEIGISSSMIRQSIDNKRGTKGYIFIPIDEFNEELLKTYIEKSNTYTPVDGGRYKKTKLHENDILAIRELLVLDEHTRDEIGEMFNVSRAMITCIKKGKSWSHIGYLQEEAMRIKDKPKIKLNKEKVINIKKLINEGEHTQGQIAEMYGVSRNTISDIKNEKTWANVCLEKRNTYDREIV